MNTPDTTAGLPSLTLWECDTRNLASSHATRHTCHFTRSFTKVASQFSQMTFSVCALRDACGPISLLRPWGWQTHTHTLTGAAAQQRLSPRPPIHFSCSCYAANSAPRCRMLVKNIWSTCGHWHYSTSASRRFGLTKMTVVECYFWLKVMLSLSL